MCLKIPRWILISSLVISNGLISKPKDVETTVNRFITPTWRNWESNISFHERYNVNMNSTSNSFNSFRNDPYVRSSIGNLVGIPIGGFLGAIVAGGIWGRRRTGWAGDPDAGLYNIGIAIIGMYVGGVLGSATGSTIALASGLSNKERLTIFAYSLAPHLVHMGMVYHYKNFLAEGVGFTITVSIPLSIVLPAWKYKRITVIN